jgi:hypothetical protein
MKRTKIPHKAFDPRGWSFANALCHNRIDSRADWRHNRRRSFDHLDNRLFWILHSPVCPAH